MKANKLKLDELNRKIIAELQKNGKRSFKKIAQKLNVSDGTVRFRTEKMINDGLLKIKACINPFVFENAITALVGINLSNRAHKTIMDKIFRLQGVQSVCNISGRFDLLVEVFLDSREDLRKFLVEDLSGIDGIRSTETFVYLEAINKTIELPETVT